MHRNLAASILPVVFAFVSLGTAACTAESEVGAAGEGASEPSAMASPADALAGSASSSSDAPRAQLPTEGAHAQALATPYAARLRVLDGTGKSVAYDVVDYSFGIDNETGLGGSNAGARDDLGAGKATLRPLQVRVAKGTQHLLGQDLLGTANATKVVLERLDAKGQPVELASLTGATVTSHATTADGSTSETFSILGMSLKVTQGAASVTFDRTTNTATCADPCPCAIGGGEGKLGPYTQAGALAMIPKDSTRIDAVRVVLHKEAPPSAGSGAATASKPVLDEISFSNGLEKSGVCAIFYAARATHMSEVRIGVAAPTAGGKVASLESTTWNACLAMVESVSISSSDAGPQAEVQLTAGGLVRTDRPVDAAGKVTGETKVGWSFVTNQPIGSCAATLP